MKSPRIPSPYSSKRLESYARWYYGRYFPSIEALRDKILKKCEFDREKTEFVLAKIQDIFIEELLIDQRVRFLIDGHKNESFILQNLKKKKFDTALVKQKLEEYRADLESWESHKHAIEKKYLELQKRWKSHKTIIRELMGKFHHFRDEILSMNMGEDSENLRKIYEKLTNGKTPESTAERQKIAAKLMQRWFDYGEIKRIVFDR